MYNKNVKKTFEILRSEITFLMDLYNVYLHDPIRMSTEAD